MWYYNNNIVETLPEDKVGFVYLITNLSNNRKYIGKKLAITVVKLKPLKGKTRKRHVRRETDWRTYWGSSQYLLEDISNLGESSFHREILYWCHTKTEMSYIEAKEQFAREVLHTDEYYNGIIHCRVNRPR